MNIKNSLSILLFLQAANTFAIGTIQPSVTVNLVVPEYGNQLNFPDVYDIDVLKMRFDKNERSILDLYFVSVPVEDEDSGFFYGDINESKRVTFNTTSQSFSSAAIDDIFPLENQLVSSATSVYVDKEIYLENSYLKYPGDYGPSTHGFNMGYGLERAILSDDKEKIVGIIETNFDTGDRIGYYYQDRMGIWTSLNGKSVYIQEIIFWNIYGVHEYPSIEIGFSTLNHYAYMRRLEKSEYRNTNGITNIHNFAFVYLYDLNKNSILMEEVDIAFTSDERFYATVRDGVPTLVATQTRQALQSYDVGGGLVSALVFSPDNQTLYAATHDDRLYVFESQLPESAAGEWELYR